MAGIDSYTKFLSHFNGSDAQTTYTAETGQTITFTGGVELDTSNKQFGASAVLFDGADSTRLTVPDSADWYFGTDPFTIDLWCYTASKSNRSLLFQQDDSTHMNFAVGATGTSLRAYVDVRSGGTISAQYFTPNDSLPLSQWNHVAYVRDGSDFYIFINGVSQSLTVGTAIAASEMPNFTGNLIIGTYYWGGGYTETWNGAIDELRISKGIARWTDDFTAPTSEYTGDSGFMTCNKGFWGA